MHLLRRGAGDPILFIHGLPTSNQLWNGVVERMAGRFTCLAVDLPGLGKTPSVPYGQKYLQGLAETIDTLRIKNGIERWHVVGHDAGSAVAVHYAHQFQQHVDCLALLSPALFPELKPYFLFDLLRKPVLGEVLAPFVNFAFWNIAMRVTIGGNEEDLSEAVKDFHLPFSGIRGPWEFMRLLRWGQPAEVLAAIPDFLPCLRSPTLIFHGLRDPAASELLVRRASALIPNSELVTVDAGHFIPLNRPEFVARTLLRFFDQQSECRQANRA